MMEPLSGYDVGALMYCPAHGHGAIVDARRREQYPKPFSLAFCLEDTVRAEAVPEAADSPFTTEKSWAGYGAADCIRWTNPVP